MNSLQFKSIVRRVILGVGTSEDDKVVEKYRSIRPEADRIFLETLQYYSQATLHRLRKSGAIPTIIPAKPAPSILSLVRGESEQISFEPLDGEMGRYSLEAIERPEGGVLLKLQMLSWTKSDEPAVGSLTAFLAKDEATLQHKRWDDRQLSFELSEVSSEGGYAIKVMSTELDCVDSFPIDLSMFLRQSP